MNHNKLTGVLVLLIVILLVVGCVPAEPTTLTMDWFTMRQNVYAEQTLTFDFYYYEDHDPDSYYGTINIRNDGQGWYVDEYVDILPFRHPETNAPIGEQAIQQSMIRFASNIKFILSGGPFDSAWRGHLPQDFGDHTNYRYILEEVSK